MVRFITVLAMSLVLVSIVILGNEPPPEPTQPKETTVTGCLEQGASADHFVLVEENTTYQVQAAEGIDLAPHLNHRVELTGTVEMTESSLVFNARGLKMVATSCVP